MANAQRQVDHAGVRISPAKIDSSLLKRAIDSVKKGGRLDVVVSPLPPTLEELEEVTRHLYGFAPARPSELDFTVLFRDDHAGSWDLEVKKDSPSNDSPGSSQQTQQSPYLGKYETVALGGTFDHMHWGHRLMLTVAAYSARKTVVVGVTEAHLLQNKKYREAMESYEIRAESAKAFIKYLVPSMTVDVYPLEDMYGPTITVKGIEALVVSTETSKGGEQVNTKRNEMQWPSLDILEVNLIIPHDSDEKLSSTDLRREDLHQQGLNKNKLNKVSL